MGKALIRRRPARTETDITRVLKTRKLTAPQRLAIRALVMTATRNEALELLRSRGMTIEGKLLSQWMQNSGFREALAGAEEVVANSITKNSLLRKTEAVLEVAMKGTPILGYVGKDEQEIVGYKPDLPSAARLIEIQGKTIGAFADDNVMKLAVMVDIVFDGRKENPAMDPAAPVMDAEFSEVGPTQKEGDWLG